MRLIITIVKNNKLLKYIMPKVTNKDMIKAPIKTMASVINNIACLCEREKG